tara:strand:- start:75 stop:1052 length:978 start_codon:yes stop_codon:yes gene_type:complete
MAGLLDYYKEHPELWAENEHLVAKDPAYNLGLMDLEKMSFEERPGGKIPRSTGWMGGVQSLLYSLGMDKPAYRPLGRTLGAYLHLDAPDEKAPGAYPGLTRGNIALYTDPFTKGDTPMPWTDPNLVPPSERMNEPLYNIDKARVIGHENRHRLTEENPELYNLQPDWTGLNVQSDDPEAEETWIQKLLGLGSTAENKAAKKQHWRNEAFNRFMDFQYFPDVQFRGKSVNYPRSLSSKNLKPQDMYFDKIWRDHWKPTADKYEKTLEKIAARKNVPGTPIVPMDRGRGRDPSQGNTVTGHGKSGMGRDPRDRMEYGGLATMFARRR